MSLALSSSKTLIPSASNYCFYFLLRLLAEYFDFVLQELVIVFNLFFGGCHVTHCAFPLLFKFCGLSVIYEVGG